MTNLSGKTVILTGASRGIGRFIAYELAKQKANIICISRSQEELERVCSEINDLGGQGTNILFDISNIEDLKILVKKIEQLVDSVDILINNAGIEICSAFQDYTLEDMQSVLSINLLAPMELTRLLLENMLIHGSGHIINIASLAGKKGQPYNSIYSASKAGLIMWANALRQELVTTGVNVSTICPGYISDYGLLADTGIPSPKLAGISTAQNVATAVVQVIQKNQVEVVINGSIIMQFSTKLLMATEQIFPGLGDVVNRWIGITKLNKNRIKNKSVRGDEIYIEMLKKSRFVKEET
jgi:short-subunit dehydrogenase